MKIVIEIPEKTYKRIKSDNGHGYCSLRDDDERTIVSAICEGKVKRNCKDCIGSDLWYYAMCSECKNKNKFSKR